MNKFRSLMREAGEQGGKPLVNNFRPVQPIKARNVYSSFPVATHSNGKTGYDVKDKPTHNSATYTVFNLSSLFAIMFSVILSL